MFKSATLKLTLSYLAVLMILSVSFSAVVYNISSHELGRGLGLNGKITVRARPDVVAVLEQMILESRQRLLANLIFTNVAVLIAGGALSYALARYTLRPIEESHEAQSRFTADASHELRTPLTAMKTEIEVALKTQKFTKSQRQILESNLEELQKLTQLSDNLLRLARVDGNGIQKEPVQVSAVIRGAVERTLPLAEQKSILIEAKEQANLSIIGDKDSLIELLVILIDNAVKYSPEKSRVQVKTAEQHGQVHVSVTDEGIGIKASEIPHLFERFYRADSSRSNRNIKGYGLGLSIAQEIANQHHGDIQIKSKPGIGSTFTVSLPLS